ncbi:hypothetical protein KKG48_03145 [Patescibacteria group bacterium]|nr:hypothetical protein [Patescibacteria group bacterium]MCG2695285.1 hypothetical protein [Candidatus Parcubacteria bacterium]
MGILNDWSRKIFFGDKNDRSGAVFSVSKKSNSQKIKKTKSMNSLDILKSQLEIPPKIETETKFKTKTKIPATKKPKVDSFIVKKVKKKILKKEPVKKIANKKTAKKVVKKSDFSVKKFEGNPIIRPGEKNRWESKATFNPAVLHAEGKIHLLYRAMGDGDISVLGYVSSKDGFTMSKRLDNPAFFSANTHQRPKKGAKSKVPPISYVSGGGLNGGCEDPRLTLIEGKVYLTYTAFDGWGSLRMALSSISLKDFLKKKWNWEKPILISPPGQIHKNWVLFPEKVEGKFAVLHSISPEILVDYFEDLNFKDGKYIESYYDGKVNDKNRWDDRVRGAGPPPIKTKEGWLLIYHSMDSRDPDKYKMGAMLLDLKDPQKILVRSKEPFLEPDMHYENEGWKSGVSYCCGATVKDGQLLIYYGGADKFSCVATADMDKFLETLIKTGKPKVKKVKRESLKKISS